MGRARDRILDDRCDDRAVEDRFRLKRRRRQTECLHRLQCQTSCEKGEAHREDHLIADSKLARIHDGRPIGESSGSR